MDSKHEKTKMPYKQQTLLKKNPKFSKRKPNLIETDRGKKFLSKSSTALLNKNNIKR